MQTCFVEVEKKKINESRKLTHMNVAAFLLSVELMTLNQFISEITSSGMSPLPQVQYINNVNEAPPVLHRILSFPSPLIY